MRFVIVAVLVGWLSGTARAQSTEGEAVALLPLDADQRLEIYGQPVASEVARALVAGGIDVVVVGPKMAVPERARLIVDGTITAGKTDTVSLTLRIRDRSAGTVLDTLTATAPSLTTIDSAAIDLAGRALPATKKWLASFHRPTDHVVQPTKVPTVVAPPAPLLVAVGGEGAGKPLHVALIESTKAWAHAHHREARAIDLGSFARDQAVKTVAGSGTDLGISFDVLGYTVVPGSVPMARARVRVRIADGSHVAFDRVIVTDTVVGDRGLAPDAFVARVGREVLEIVQPNMRRAIPAWR
jgi:hypothetical protein